MPSLTLDEIRDLSLDEINRRWPEVKEALTAAANAPRPAVPAPGELTREHIRFLSSEQVIERWGEISRLLAKPKTKDQGEQNE